LLVTNSTNLRFAGRSSVLKYTGTTDAVAATNFQGLVIAGGALSTSPALVPVRTAST
jgi:hypothetical protein